MSTRHACGTDHHGEPLAEARCGWHSAVLAHLEAYASGLDNPVSQVALRDLWAHARTVRDDGSEAARWVRLVLDLGWRPQVQR